MAASRLCARRLPRPGLLLLLALLLDPRTALAAALDPGSAITPLPSVTAATEPCAVRESLRRGTLLLRQGRHAAARAAFAAFLERAPQAEAFAEVANAYLAEGQLPDAVAAIRDMVRLGPDPDLDQMVHGLVLVLEGSTAQAVATLTESVRRHPNARLWNLLGQQLDIMGRNLGAIRAYAQAVKLHPDEPRYWMNLGEAHERVGQYAHALAAYREVPTRRASAGAWAAIGRTELEGRQYAAAAEAYREALRLAPDDLDALVGLGIAYGAQKDWASALDVHYKVKAVDPAAAEELFGIVFRGKKT
jgi:tetratricopeptide (TPR) repeat protein